jgi:hypothetical protein
MPTIFVLDVPEFGALVEHARSRADYSVTGPARGYWRISAADTLEFERKALGFKPAVWHGALTGGLIGRIERFDNDRLCISADRPA